MQLDTELAEVVNDLLRTDTRLLAAAPLLGRIAVVVTEPKPERKPRRTSKKLAPPTTATIAAAGGTTTVTIHAGDIDAIREVDERLREAAESEGDNDQPKPPHAPWLKVVKPSKVSDTLRAVHGDKFAAVLQVDGGLWNKLRTEDQRRALALALRRIRHETKDDGSDKVTIEAPPLQCWPDTADDLSHLIAALGPDGAEGAAAVSAAESLAIAGSDALLPSRVPPRSVVRETQHKREIAHVRSDRSYTWLHDDQSAMFGTFDAVGSTWEVLATDVPDAASTLEAARECVPGSFIHDEDGGPEENEGQA
jgi:hypothetical protein